MSKGRQSLPSRGAWVEIRHPKRPAPCSGRSPRGERGLKCICRSANSTSSMSLPSRGAWVEIITPDDLMAIRDVAPLAGSVG